MFRREGAFEPVVGNLDHGRDVPVVGGRSAMSVPTTTTLPRRARKRRHGRMPWRNTRGSYKDCSRTAAAYTWGGAVPNNWLCYYGPRSRNSVPAFGVEWRSADRPPSSRRGLRYHW